MIKIDTPIINRAASKQFITLHLIAAVYELQRMKLRDIFSFGNEIIFHVLN